MALKSVNARMRTSVMGTEGCGETGGNIACVTSCTTLALLAVHLVSWKHTQQVTRVSLVAFFFSINKKKKRGGEEEKEAKKIKSCGLQGWGSPLRAWLTSGQNCFKLRTWISVEMISITMFSVVLPSKEEIGIREPKATELRPLSLIQASS